MAWRKRRRVKYYRTFRMSLKAEPWEVSELPEELSAWHWEPRYRVADLERAGATRADAVTQVRAEVGAILVRHGGCDE